MRNRRFVVFAIGIIAVLGVRPPLAAAASEREPDDDRAVRALVDVIDRRVAAKWAEAGVEPAARADDAEFLRRVSLDLVGKIPTAAETRDFLEDPAPDKRARLVDALLASPAYVGHWTSLWRALLVPEIEAGTQLQVLAPDFEAWLRDKVAANTGYDVLARELIAVSLDGTQARRGFNPFDGENRKPTPLAYFVAKDAKPENLAAGTARTFLGIRIECAQCHDHPFARWKREQFWSYAAFFGGVQKQGPAGQLGTVREVADRRELPIPGTEKVVQATFLDGEEPQWRSRVGSRVTLADWITAEDNPYFARAGANRLWAQLFGTGLVDPVDDLSDANPPSHPELLDELAREFARHGFDPKFLLRALTASRAYQLSSDGTSATASDPRLFARMAVKGLSAEQLYDSLVQATGRTPDARGRNNPFVISGPYRNEFLQRFARRDERPIETQTSILQALAMMNGGLVGESTNLSQGPTLGAVADAPFLDTAGKLETLFLATLNRKPRPDELDRLVAYVEGTRNAPTGAQLERLKAGLTSFFGGSAVVRSNGRTEALADVFWALLNSSEFMLNH